MTTKMGALYADRRLASIYDVLAGERHDLVAYERVADELGAGSVLDVGCGTGAFACRLASRGLDVTAVDPAEASIEVARAKDGAELVRWIVGDAISVPSVQADLVTMTANVAQVFVTDEAWKANLDAIAAAQGPGGHLVFETRDPAYRAWEQWTPTNTRTRLSLPAGDAVEAWCEVAAVGGELVSFRWTYVFESDGSTLTSAFTLRFRERDQVAVSLIEAGYETVEVRDAPDRPGKEMVFIARRG
jgi:SAM-dependent methyltransferase